MSRQATKHSDEALAFWTLYKAMKPQVKEELRDLFIHEAEEYDELPSAAITAISMSAFKDVWDVPENDRWDDFIQKRLQCINKEI